MKELAQFIPLGGREWVVTTPGGLFDASPKAMEWMHYAVNDRGAWSIIELNQLKDRYYEPGLLAAILEQEGATEGLRDLSAFDSVPMYPDIEASIENHTLEVHLRERDGGIGRFSLLVNNKEVFTGENEAQKDRYTFNLQDYMQFFLPPGQDNHIGIQVYNRAGWLKSPVRQLPYQPLFTAGKGFEEEKPKGSISLGKRKKHQPRLFGIVVGTAKYKLPRLVLNFPDKDAFYMKQALENAGRQLFGEDRVDITLLSTNTEQSDRVASKALIQEAFTSLAAKAKASDVLIVYLSGHGITRQQGDRSHFYYITKDTPSWAATGSTAIRCSCSGKTSRWATLP